MKTINVAAAVIFRISDSGAKEVFAVQRGYGEFKDWWEFPGGKIETGETPQQALAREIKEELDAEISVGECIGTVEYDYPFHAVFFLHSGSGTKSPFPSGTRKRSLA